MSRSALALGWIRGRRRRLAHRCAWCGMWMSEADEEAGTTGAVVSHCMCDACAADMQDDPTDRRET